MSKNKSADSEPVVIKKYANRRLYNTETSSYVTLEYLSQMVKDDRDFIVRDARTGEDITRTVLTQIIFEEESKGHTLLPEKFLRQLISFYGDGLQNVIPNYLEVTMQAFSQNQDRYREYFKDHLGSAAVFSSPQDFLSPFQEMARQNMEAFEKATKIFSPFASASENEQAQESHPSRKPETNARHDEEANSGDPSLDLLQKQLAEMQNQLNALSKKK